MNPSKKEITLALWSHRGVSHDEICARISERTDAECLAGFVLFIAITKMPMAIVATVGELAAIDRCTTAVVREVWSMVNERMPADEQVPEIRELFTLMVESMVRKAKTLFPSNPESN